MAYVGENEKINNNILSDDKSYNPFNVFTIGAMCAQHKMNAKRECVFLLFSRKDETF